MLKTFYEEFFRQTITYQKLPLDKNMRETKFSILKALAIIFVVMSQAGITGWLYNFVFLFHVPVFFLCAGYFFNVKYLADERTFVAHRVRGLYLPFLRWSVFFLVIHNLLFNCGILSENYGTANGGVLHPFTFHQFCQHLWSVVFNMSGYDQFLCGTFWFFRALLLSSIGFLILFKLLRMSGKLSGDKQAGWGLFLTGIILTAWKVGGSLTVTGVAQGGYRELMGMTFMAAGYLLRQYEVTKWIGWRVALPSFLVLAVFAVWCPTSMAWNPTFGQFAALPLPAVAGFLCLLYVSTWADKWRGAGRRLLIFIGDNTLYVFAFHLVAFKIVSALKVAWYSLPWQAVGGHPIVTFPANNALWTLLYVTVGVAVPLLWLTGYRRITPNVTFTQGQAVGFCFTVVQRVLRVVCLTGRSVAMSFMCACRSVVKGVRDIIAASSTKDE